MLIQLFKISETFNTKCGFWNGTYWVTFINCIVIKTEDYENNSEWNYTKFLLFKRKTSCSFLASFATWRGGWLFLVFSPHHPTGVDELSAVFWRQIKWRLWLCRNFATISALKVNETPLPFSIIQITLANVLFYIILHLSFMFFIPHTLK